LICYLFYLTAISAAVFSVLKKVCCSCELGWILASSSAWFYVCSPCCFSRLGFEGHWIWI